MSLIFKCGHCGHEGVRAGNGYGTWCAGCSLNSKLTLIEDTEVTRCTINGNRHLANLKVVRYDGFTIVAECTKAESVRITIYSGENPKPISQEAYGHVSSNLDEHAEGELFTPSL